MALPTQSRLVYLKGHQDPEVWFICPYCKERSYYGQRYHAAECPHADKGQAICERHFGDPIVEAIKTSSALPLFIGGITLDELKEHYPDLVKEDKA